MTNVPAHLAVEGLLGERVRGARLDARDPVTATRSRGRPTRQLVLGYARTSAMRSTLATLVSPVARAVPTVR
jgi:hypothetical protein